METMKIKLDTSDAVDSVRELRREIELLGDKAPLPEILDTLMETRRNIRCMSVACVFWVRPDRCLLEKVTLSDAKCKNFTHRERWRKMRALPEGAYHNIRQWLAAEEESDGEAGREE